MENDFLMKRMINWCYENYQLKVVLDWIIATENLFYKGFGLSYYQITWYNYYKQLIPTKIQFLNNEFLMISQIWIENQRRILNLPIFPKSNLRVMSGSKVIKKVRFNPTVRISNY